MTEAVTMKVCGLDLSLVATGLVDVTDQHTCVLKPGKRRGLERLRWIRNEVLAHTDGVALVVVEGPSYGSANGQAGHHERAGLWWCVTEALGAVGVELAVVAPAALKKYATGTGNAHKDKVLLATARHFPWFDGDNNEADALWLSAIGYDLLGTSVATLPERNREVLAHVDWIS